MPLHTISSELTYSCPACSLEFTDVSLKPLHEDAPIGTYHPPNGLLYTENLDNPPFVYMVRRSNIGPAKRGNHLHDLVFEHEEYLPGADGWQRNDMPPRDLRQRAAQSLITGLKNGRLRLLTEVEFRSFKSSYSNRDPLVRTDPELERLLQAD